MSDTQLVNEIIIVNWLKTPLNTREETTNEQCSTNQCFENAVACLRCLAWHAASRLFAAPTDQPAEMPPLMLMVCPVMRAACGLAMKTIIAARSSGWTMPRRAILATFSNSLELKAL